MGEHSHQALSVVLVDDEEEVLFSSSVLLESHGIAPVVTVVDGRELLPHLEEQGAGVVVLTTGWSPADPIISVVIAGLILVSAWRLVKEATDVLLEAVPPHIGLDAVLESLAAIEGLEDVHDVHVWTLTSGFVALAAHGVIDDPSA